MTNFAEEILFLVGCDEVGYALYVSVLELEMGTASGCELTSKPQAGCPLCGSAREQGTHDACVAEDAWGAPATALTSS
jgi:hypothetical protein